MATLTSALNTDFTPAAGNFIVQVTRGTVNLLRKNSSGATDYANVGTLTNEAAIVENPIAGAVYRFSQVGPTAPTVQADQ